MSREEIKKEIMKLFDELAWEVEGQIESFIDDEEREEKQEKLNDLRKQCEDLLTELAKAEKERNPWTCYIATSELFQYREMDDDDPFCEMECCLFTDYEEGEAYLRKRVEERIGASWEELENGLDEDEYMDSTYVVLNKGYGQLYFSLESVIVRGTGKKEIDRELETLWEQFADIPMDPKTECIESDFLDFPAGTHREEIWDFFDKRHSKGVHYLLYDREEKID